MSLKNELWTEVNNTLKSPWDKRDGQVVPEAENVGLENREAVKLEKATVLYADIFGSTKLVDTHTWQFAAKVYKSYLNTAAKIIRSEGGSITAYDGDRVMAVYIGKTKNTSAVRTALKLNYCRLYIINPLIAHYYSTSNFKIQHVVGIDTSALRVVRTGVRGANDLVWVGRAANYAAKLTALSASYPSWITGEVYDYMLDSAKFTNSQAMWEERVWTAENNKRIYCSSWYWRIQ